MKEKLIQINPAHGWCRDFKRQGVFEHGEPTADYFKAEG